MATFHGHLHGAPYLGNMPFCGIHNTSFQAKIARSGLPPQDGCRHYMTTHRWCNRAVVDGPGHRCILHRHLPPPPAPVVAAPPPAPAWTLAAIATNAQGVHTAPVTVQMNRAVAKLETVKIPREFDAMLAASQAWHLNVPMEMKQFEVYLRTINDINAWRKKDAPYAKAFRMVCFHISEEKDTEKRREMWRRLFQECVESVGMCQAGHVARLMNALSGFGNKDMRPAIPLGDLIQMKLSAISQMELADADKIRLANEFFDEHGVADEQRAPWLEALA